MATAEAGRMFLKKVLALVSEKVGGFWMGGGGWGVFWQKFDTGQRLFSDFPDVSVISYTGKPEYERVAFIR